VVRGRFEGGALGEYACPWDVVELEPDAFWVSEGERVIARRPWPFLWRTHDVRAYVLQKRVQGINVFASSGSEAQVVDAGCGLYVRGVDVLWIGAANSERGTTADVVDEVVGARINGLKTEKRHELVIEGDALLDAIDPEDDMGDAIDFQSVAGIRRGHGAAAYSSHVRTTRDALVEPPKSCARGRRYDAATAA